MDVYILYKSIFDVFFLFFNAFILLISRRENDGDLQLYMNTKI